MGRQIQTSLDKTFWMLSLLWEAIFIWQKNVGHSFQELMLESSNCTSQTASNQSIQKVSTVTTRDPRVELFGGSEAEMCPRAFLSYFGNTPRNWLVWRQMRMSRLDSSQVSLDRCGTQQKQSTNTVQSTLMRLRRQVENLNKVHFD